MATERTETILIIDDEPSIRMLFRAFLEDHGFTVSEAENGRIGLDMFRRARPDLILIDLQMPEFSGLDVLDAVTRESANTPVIVVSGTGILADVVEALHRGAWDFILKPVEESGVLLHAIEKTLDRARLIRENLAYREHLEEQIRERAASLERRTEELNELTYLASHDLQEPVRQLVAFSGLLQVDLGEDLSEKVSRDLHFISAAARRVSRLMQDLLELSRIGRLEVDRRPVALSDCADRAIAALVERMNETTVDLSRDELPQIEADAVQVFQLYLSLIDNAIKYRDADRTLRIRLTAVRENQQWVFGVRDNGIGIRKEYADQAFVPFKQLHGRDESGGTGMGLAICRKIVEHHGGRIWVESEYGHGAHFRFTLGGNPRNEACVPEAADPVSCS